MFRQIRKNSPDPKSLSYSEGISPIPNLSAIFILAIARLYSLSLNEAFCRIGSSLIYLIILNIYSLSAFDLR